jgi:hypothetical protein
MKQPESVFVEAAARAKETYWKAPHAHEELRCDPTFHQEVSVRVEKNNRTYWFQQLQRHFTRSCWLNPEPPSCWTGNTIEHVRSAFEIFTFTINGLGMAVSRLKGNHVARANTVSS